MATFGFERRFRPLDLLTEDQVEAIHSSTLSVLAGTGVAFNDDEALTLLSGNGCRSSGGTTEPNFRSG